MIRIDDIFAAVLLSIIMLRRLETLSTSHNENLHVPERDFIAWRRMALRAHNVAAVACLAKVVLSLAWLLLEPGRLGLVLGGLTIFVGWVGTLVWCWRLATDARVVRRELGIVGRGGRGPEPR